MTNTSEYTPATPESVWAAFRETDRLMKESREGFDKDFEKSRKEVEEIRNFQKETDRQLKETDRYLKKSIADYNKRMKNFEKTMGGWSNNHGSFAEEYFFNSFEKRKRNFFGEKFDKIEKNVKGFKNNFSDEYDILLINGKTVGIIEVKFKAHKDNIQKILNKVTTFRENFPYYANHRVYLGLATLVFTPELEDDCLNNGIAVIKQLGNKVIIYDEHLKVF